MAKPGERKLQILQTLAEMLENPKGEKITTAALAAQARLFGSGALPPLRQQGADVRRPDRVHRIQPVFSHQPIEAEEAARAASKSNKSSPCCSALPSATAA
jgi:hypothetical protein